MKENRSRRTAVSGLAAGILIFAIAIPFIVSGETFELSKFLPIAVYQAGWCFVEGWFVQKHRPLSAVPDFRGRPGILPLATGLVALLIVIVAVADATRSETTAPAIVILGFVIGGSGIVMRQISIVKLGPHFRDSIDLRENHEHVSTGLYAFCRHPAEMGFALAMGGFLLICGSGPASILFGTALVPLILIRVHRENRLLRERFGV